MARLAIQYGAEIDTRERKYGFTPLHLAIHKSKLQLVFVSIQFCSRVFRSF